MVPFQWEALTPLSSSYGHARHVGKADGPLLRVDDVHGNAVEGNELLGLLGETFINILYVECGADDTTDFRNDRVFLGQSLRFLLTSSKILLPPLPFGHLCAEGIIGPHQLGGPLRHLRLQFLARPLQGSFCRSAVGYIPKNDHDAHEISLAVLNGTGAALDGNLPSMSPDKDRMLLRSGREPLIQPVEVRIGDSNSRFFID